MQIDNHMTKANELLRHSFVITTNESRYQSFIYRFQHAQLPLPIRFDGFSLSDCIYGCALSHLSIVKFAKAMNFPYVAIFEDDAAPYVNARDRIEFYLNNIPNNVDVVKLGWLKVKDNFKCIDRVFQSNWTTGSHAYIVFKHYYDKYEKIFNDMSYIADHELINPIGENCSSNILTTNENLFIQYDIPNSVGMCGIQHDEQFWKIANIEDKYIIE